MIDFFKLFYQFQFDKFFFRIQTTNHSLCWNTMHSDALLNGINWEQPLSHLDLNSPTDPDIITLLSSSSLISPVVLPNQPPNALVAKFLQSLMNTRSNLQITLRPHGKSLQSIFYCLHCVVSKLILMKPNWRNHNLIPLCQDDSALIQKI